ncbi:alpha/beta fold hydrolase [Avibacterium volantium]|uniref:alpha/beta fold hydrolase n=1 Tax=Avibacterium volantium TaxID=762 RepID=UPI003BF902EB
MDSLDGDVLLVGHSWGGVVISAAGNHEKVKKLLYLSAIVPNSHESAQMTLQRHNSPMEGLTPDAFGLIRLPTVQAFAHVMDGDLPEQEIAYRFASQ